MKYHSAPMYHMDRHNVAFDLFYKGLQRRLLHLQINGLKNMYMSKLCHLLYTLVRSTGCVLTIHESLPTTQ